ncbi:Sphingolipid delta(4)-desaturase DES1 [Amphibalanus amphitrite]|uniref:sphingolipid 4-desaturase n=1 Tax=Amphibalanus amphitrite TaxID=1232801 RepID=A0A6A4WZ73_AMPAM|nr:Sphingolipid delta(4)-desaturase DES1 [Amphibalanus amphitrite]
MGQHVSHSDFEWSYTEEPHATRRKEILKKYPEMKRLFGRDERMPYKVTAMVLFQLVSIYLVSGRPWLQVIALAYCLGGIINHSLMLAIHELAHNLAFGHSRPLANRLLGIFANLPIGIPFSVAFKAYHLEHHRYQGDERLDTDLPTALEARLFCTTFGKFVWVLLQPLFYALRPVITYPKPPTALELVNTTVQMSFNVAVGYYLGARAVFYMLGGSLMAMGLHPVAGHFISEHYMFKKGYETYSYYGPLNAITFNVGYHNEHHDFPAIPGCRLPEVRKIAPEYYDNLPQHNSWVRVLYDFVTDPEIGPYARVKRKYRGL